MRETVTLIALLASVLLISCASRDQIVVRVPMPHDRVESDLVSIELDNVALSDVLRMFQRPGRAGDFSQYDDVRVTASYTNVHWETTLRDILSQHGVALKESPPGSGVYQVVDK